MPNIESIVVVVVPTTRSKRLDCSLHVPFREVTCKSLSASTPGEEFQTFRNFFPSTFWNAGTSGPRIRRCLKRPLLKKQGKLHHYYQVRLGYAHTFGIGSMMIISSALLKTFWSALSLIRDWLRALNRKLKYKVQLLRTLGSISPTFYERKSCS